MPPIDDIIAQIQQLDETTHLERVQAAAVVQDEDIHGENAPLTIRCDDGTIYIVKAIGEPTRRWQLASDYCFTRLARALHVDVAPVMTLVDFPGPTVAGDQLPAIWALNGIIAPGVGSLRVDDATDSKLRGLSEPWEHTSLAWVIAFQTWCGGCDASAIVQDETLRVWTIDHARFAGTESIDVNGANGKDSVFIPLGMDRGSALARAACRIPYALRAIEALPEGDIIAAFGGREPSWGVSAADRARVVDFLLRRRARTRQIIEPWLDHPTDLSNTPVPDSI